MDYNNNNNNNNNENVNKNTAPSQVQVFKRSAAMRLQLDKPDRADQRFKIGSIYLQFAEAVNGNGTDNGYQWKDEKISVKLNVVDISKILYGFANGSSISLYHTFRDNDTKKVLISPKNGGGLWFKVEHTLDGKTKTISVPVDPEEQLVITTMLQFALPLIHNWI